MRNRNMAKAAIAFPYKEAKVFLQKKVDTDDQTHIASNSVLARYHNY
jgi:hypothetical protein